MKRNIERLFEPLPDALEFRLKESRPDPWGVVKPVCQALKKGTGQIETGRTLQLISGPAWEEWQKYFRADSRISPFAVLATSETTQEPEAKRVTEVLKGFGHPWRDFLRLRHYFERETLPAVIALVCKEGDFPESKNYCPGRWNSIFGLGLQEANKRLVFDPLNRLAIVIFGEKMWRRPHYSPDRLNLSIRHELSHALTLLAMAGVESPPDALSYPLWEAIADNLATIIEDCFSEGMLVDPPLVKIISDRENYRNLGGTSPLVNAILWGSTVQLGHLAHRSGKPPHEVFTQWLEGRRFEYPRRRFCYSGLGHQGYGAQEATAWFLSVLRTETKNIIKEDQVGPDWLRPVFDKYSIPQPKDVKDLLLADNQFLDHYLYPLYLTRGREAVLEVVNQTWKEQAGDWQPWGGDSLPKI